MEDFKEKYINPFTDEDNLKYYLDLKNSLDTAKQESKMEIAKNMLEKGFEITAISDLTGLTKEDIEKLK